jgi:hypothetical protein
MAATARPWHSRVVTGKHVTRVYGGGLPGTEECVIVCEVPYGQHADAAMIVRAVNCHDELLAALQAVRNHGSRGELDGGISVSYLVESAIAKATGERPGVV